MSDAVNNYFVGS